MRKHGVIFMMVATYLAVGIGALGQETSPGKAYIERYAELPYSRAEDGGFVLGSPDANVTIVEFSDFMCPHCQDYEEVIQEFIAEYVAAGKARFEYRMFPVVDPVLSVSTAQLAECADTVKAGMFWPARDLLFDLAQQGLIEAAAPSVVVWLGLDMDALNDCLASEVGQYEVDAALAQNLGIRGTPAVMMRTGDGDPQWIEFDGQTMNRGGAPYEVLQAVAEGDARVTTVPPDRLLNDRLLNDTSLVTGEPCAAPCWHGITPGETHWDDALEMLDEDVKFTDVELQEVQDGAVLQAHWGPVEDQACCFMYTYDREVVSGIVLETAPVLMLGEVIAEHGDPTYVVASEVSPDQAALFLFYPEARMIVRVFVAGAATGELSEVSQVIGVYYMTEDEIDGIIEGSNLYAWQGYQSFQEYAESEFAATDES